MEIIFILTIAALILIGIGAIKRLEDNIRDEIYEAHTCIEHTLLSEHKKTRKDQQEIKTRLTQVRKDLNKIEGNQNVTQMYNIDEKQIKFKKPTKK